VTHVHNEYVVIDAIIFVMVEIRSNEKASAGHTHDMEAAAGNVTGIVGFDFSVSNLPAAGAARSTCIRLGSVFRAAAESARGTGHGAAMAHEKLSEADLSSAGTMQ
jgi:hypothetical protein